MSRFNPASANQSVEDAIQAVKGGLGNAPAASQLDSWIRLLDGDGPGAQGAILTELITLKNYIQQGDPANISHSLHRVGLLTAKAAETAADEETGSKLRRLSEALVAASAALPA